MTDRPYYIDDPLVDRQAHKLLLDLDPVASAHAGRDLNIGTCSCGTMPTTSAWDGDAVFEAYDTHMANVQEEAHQAAAETRRREQEQARQAVVDDWNARVPVGTPVRYWAGAREGDGRISRTRTVAQLLGGHTPVVWVEGESSCIALTHVQLIDVGPRPR